MSQQGIFSIAPDSQGDSATANGRGNGSPFAPSNEETRESAKTSPFQRVNGSSASEEESRAGIPQRRPEGQPPAMGGGSVDAETPTVPVVQDTVFQAVQESPINTQEQNGANGGAFQMNGFPEHRSIQEMEAAPVPLASPQEASPFMTAHNDPTNYETAKAGLEPQQDFAAVAPRFSPGVETAQPTQQAQTAQQAAPIAQAAQTQASSPTLTPVATAAFAGNPANSNTAVGSGVTSGFQQLELRAIFGVDHVLDLNEILQRARTLPGIRNVAVVGNQEAAALSNFRQAMQSMGFGDSNQMKLNAGGGSVDFITEDNATIAVLLEGSYGPGVQETLIIVAREIGKLA